MVVESLRFCQHDKGPDVHAWCLMSNHVHLIVSAREPNKLSDILRDLKKFTPSQILQAIAANDKESRRNRMPWIFKKAGEKNKRNEDYQLWQQDNHPVQCDTNDIPESRMRYLHENPVRAGLVRYEQDYVYSLGIGYYTGGKGLIGVELV